MELTDIASELDSGEEPVERVMKGSAMIVGFSSAWFAGCAEMRYDFETSMQSFLAFDRFPSYVVTGIICLGRNSVLMREEEGSRRCGRFVVARLFGGAHLLRLRNSRKARAGRQKQEN